MLGRLIILLKYRVSGIVKPSKSIKSCPKKKKEDETWIDKCRNGYAALVAELKEGIKKIDEEKAKRDALQKKVDERQKLLDEIKIKKESEVETNKSTKQVSPIELHEYESINESCRKRLVTKTYTEEDKARWDKEFRSKYQELVKDVQRKRLLAKQGDWVKEEEGIDSDSDEDKEGDVVVSTEPRNKRGGKPGSRGRGRGGRRRLLRSVSRVPLASFRLRKELPARTNWTLRSPALEFGYETGLQGRDAIPDSKSFFLGRRLGHETGLYKNERGIGLTSWTSSVNVYIWTFFFCRSASWNGLVSPYRSFRILDDMIGFSFVLASDSRSSAGFWIYGSFGWILDLRMRY
ncbi:unnamed protein product [Rhizophagus irregularis]|nr:unnamed protein product [Rhizophagus irregularis]